MESAAIHNRYEPILLIRQLNQMHDGKLLTGVVLLLVFKAPSGAHATVN
jgi:hypothetical protein